MIDENTALRNFDEHFHITAEEDEEIRLMLPQFIIYRKNGADYDCYCTACQRCFTMQPQCHGFNSVIKHNASSKCPECCEDGHFLAGGRIPVNGYHHQQNIVILRAIDNDLYISCSTAVQRFVKDMHDWDGITDSMPDFTLREKHRYVCSDDGALHFRASGGNWRRVKSLKEPHFGTGGFYYPDNSYKVISESEFSRTCMRYCMVDRYLNVSDNTQPARFVEYLCTLARYPALEKLIKCGFESLVYNYIDSPKHKLLNVRATEPKKMLRLNAQEMRALRGCDRVMYEQYLDFRRLVHINGDFWRKWKVFLKFRALSHRIVSIAKKAGLSHETVMNYIDKQRPKHMMLTYVANDWEDYLDQCAQMNYDLTDTAVSKPKDLHAAHERTTKLMKDRKNEQLKALFADLMEQRKTLEYCDDGLVVIQPHSMTEIVDEGKALSHCVGGYAERHARGELSIMFLRKADAPDVPYYTIEVSKKNEIVQCRGYKNNIPSRGGDEKSREIKNFEEKYQKYLNTLTKKARKTA